jgi:hypothetical protein
MVDTNKILGQTVNERYRIVELIGKGGSGHVYKAVNIEDNQEVALKLVKDVSQEDPESIIRFEKEVAVAARLTNPHTVRVFEFGRTMEGYLIIVMEFLRGRSLTRIIESEAPLVPERAVNLVRQTLEALAEAHRVGIVHRDLKPDNIFLTTDDQGREFVKVLDFGIAKFLHDDSVGDTLTRDGFVFGTPLYISPEQALGWQVNAASDIYSLGVLFFEMLAGEPPFTAETPIGLGMKHIYEPPPIDRLKVEQGPLSAVKHLLSLMLEKRPEKRPANAGTALALFHGIGKLDGQLFAVTPQKAGALGGPTTEETPTVKAKPVTGEQEQVKEYLEPHGSTAAGEGLQDARKEEDRMRDDGLEIKARPGTGGGNAGSENEGGKRKKKRRKKKKGGGAESALGPSPQAAKAAAPVEEAAGELDESSGELEGEPEAEAAASSAAPPLKEELVRPAPEKPRVDAQPLAPPAASTQGSAPRRDADVPAPPSAPPAAPTPYQRQEQITERYMDQWGNWVEGRRREGETKSSAPEDQTPQALAKKGLILVEHGREEVVEAPKSALRAAPKFAPPPPKPAAPPPPKPAAPPPPKPAAPPPPSPEKQPASEPSLVVERKPTLKHEFPLAADGDEELLRPGKRPGKELLEEQDDWEDTGDDRSFRGRLGEQDRPIGVFAWIVVLLGLLMVAIAIYVLWAGNRKPRSHHLDVKVDSGQRVAAVSPVRALWDSPPSKNG